MAQPNPNLPAKRYSEEDIDRGLQAFASLGKQAEQETGISIHTLKDWAYKTHRDKYQLFKDARHGEAARELAVQFEDNARKALSIQDQLLETIDVTNVGRRPDEAARIAANLSKVASAATGQMQVLRDRPQQVQITVKNIDELDTSFAQRFGPKWTENLAEATGS